ncbi:uncharacterized protein [Oncorhynchus clarkii lewisi]|uniref:uncharacterized protein isoform X11 n=1 Tax=Oncorhynchus clarkii lewisi TaxID=490388 RepID=UPI0039B977D6
MFQEKHFRTRFSLFLNKCTSFPLIGLLTGDMDLSLLVAFCSCVPPALASTMVEKDYDSAFHYGQKCPCKSSPKSRVYSSDVMIPHQKCPLNLRAEVFGPQPLTEFIAFWGT